MSQSVTHYYHTNHRGDTAYLTGASGVTAASYVYDAFGCLLAQSGIWHPASGIRHPASGIRHPASGTWTTKDPLSYYGSWLNLYMYVANAPLCCVDSYGLGDSWLNGKVVNNSTNSVIILTGSDGPQGQGHYERLGPGEASRANGDNWEDVDGVWVNGTFYALGWDTLIINCDGSVTGGTKWDGSPKSPNAPYSRGAANNAPPTPVDIRPRTP